MCRRRRSPLSLQASNSTWQRERQTNRVTSVHVWAITFSVTRCSNVNVVNIQTPESSPHCISCMWSVWKVNNRYGTGLTTLVSTLVSEGTGLTIVQIHWLHRMLAHSYLPPLAGGKNVRENKNDHGPILFPDTFNISSSGPTLFPKNTR